MSLKISLKTLSRKFHLIAIYKTEQPPASNVPNINFLKINVLLVTIFDNTQNERLNRRK